MLKLIIEDDEGRKTVVPFVRDEITIGRQEGNTIRLTERNVSRRHARLVRLNGHVVVEDLGSYNGTRLNGERIAGQSPLKEGDLIQIGDYDLALQSEGAANVAGPITTKVPSAFSPTASNSGAMRRTEPAMEALGEPEQEEPEQEDYEASAGAPEEDEDEDGDAHDHTPPSSSAEKRRHSTSIIRLDQVESDRPRQVEDIPTEEAPRLLVLGPEEFRGQEFACIRTELRIGRTDDNDIALDHRSLSRTHVKLVREDTGEWRVIDMQSANGLTVNGESYAQATLGSGDIIELGHVKLRFLHAGDVADDLPAGAGGSRSKLPLVAGLVAVLLGAGAAAFFVLRAPVAPGPVPEEPQTAEAGMTPTPAEPQPSGGTQAAAGQPAGDTPEAPPEPQAPAPALQDKVAEAEQYLTGNVNAGRLQLAKTLLEGTADAQGNLSQKAQELLKVVNAELQVHTRLDEAERLLNAERRLTAEKLADAEAALDESRDTRFFKERHTLLADRLAAARQQTAAAAPPAPSESPGTAGPGQQTAVPAAATEPAEDPRVTQALAEGKQNIREKKYALAIRRLKECIQVAPTQAECHLYLGGAFAAEKKPDEGLKHYRRFLELAPPSHPRFDYVKTTVENYEAAVQQ